MSRFAKGTCMVKLHVSPVFVGSHLTLGPAPWFRVVRDKLYQGLGEDVVGELKSHQWNIRGRHYTVMQADANSTLHFESATGQAGEEQGPFEELYVVDGSIYGDRKLLAQYDEHNRTWRSSRTMEPYPVIVLTSRGLAAPERIANFKTAAR
jgi:hypothetical protein